MSDPTQTVFQMISDPGHGWLAVPVALLNDLEIQTSISRFSYLSRDRETAYLEEDCDMGVFWSAFKVKFGCPPQYKNEHQGSTFIRNLKSYPQSN